MTMQVPYSTASIPDQARLRVRTAVERNGLVMLWHHADNEQPSWDPPVIDQVEEGDWVYQGRNEFIVNCHIQVGVQFRLHTTFLNTLKLPLGYTGEWS